MKAPFKAFTATFVSKAMISPSLARVTFTGDFTAVNFLGLDQRVKLIFPAPGHEPFIFPPNQDWYQSWKNADHDTRGTMRSYTIKSMTTHELIIDFAIHEPAASPAMVWLSQAQQGSTLTTILPLLKRTQYVRPRLLGVEWNPPEYAVKLAIYADITSLPAAMNIVTDYLKHHDKRELSIQLFLVNEEDAQELRELIAGQSHIKLKVLNFHPDKLHHHSGQLLWDIGEQLSEKPKLYAWVAAERSIVRKIRQRLKQKELDLEISCMGYWRKGESALD
ncbi:MAG: siderophore-interacting protein [Micrococcaceae bacterium]